MQNGIAFLSEKYNKWTLWTWAKDRKSDLDIEAISIYHRVTKIWAIDTAAYYSSMNQVLHIYISGESIRIMYLFLFGFRLFFFGLWRVVWGRWQNVGHNSNGHQTGGHRGIHPFLGSWQEGLIKLLCSEVKKILPPFLQLSRKSKI